MRTKALVIPRQACLGLIEAFALDTQEKAEAVRDSEASLPRPH